MQEETGHADGRNGQHHVTRVLPNLRPRLVRAIFANRNEAALFSSLPFLSQGLHAPIFAYLLQ